MSHGLISCKLEVLTAENYDRDCRSLQSLAPNVNIVNMYGTTEVRIPHR